MIIKEREYIFKIEPKNHVIVAEIFRIERIGDTGSNIFLISKSFGNWFRSIRDEDYKDAREWAENHLKNIYHANK